MKQWMVLTLSLGLVAGTVLSSHAQLPLSRTPATAPCEATAVASGVRKGQAIEATVTKVDPDNGQLEFTTGTGAFVLTTTAELHDLQVGDHLLLCLHADDREDGARVMQEVPTAPAKPAETLRSSLEPIPEPLTETKPGESRHE